MAIYAGGAVFALWLTSTVIGAINNVPLVRAIIFLLVPKFSGAWAGTNPS